jgi:hypothetical protein
MIIDLMFKQQDRLIDTIQILSTGEPLKK